ncbi:MAG: hypothetical protein LH617_15140 [Ramlibacter sp.]|nr:hypothetical protein [Ramlibacter sp.]
MPQKMCCCSAAGAISDSDTTPALGRAFLMREWLELSSEEICKDLGLTATNLYVQLHERQILVMRQATGRWRYYAEARDGEG